MAEIDSRLRQRGSKHGKPVWTAVVSLPRGADGARRQWRFTFVGTKTAANKKLDVEIAAIAAGTFVAPDHATFGQYLGEWMTSAKLFYAGKTWERYESIARVHVVPRLGDVPLQRLTTSQLKTAYVQWRESGLSAQTVTSHHRLIHRVLANALDEGRVRRNVAAAIKKDPALKVTRREMRFLSQSQMSALFEAAAGTRFAPLIALALATGARRGELLGLKWDDVDFARGTIAVRRSLEQTKAGVVEKTPKSGKARIISLGSGALETLRRHRRTEAEAYGLGRTAGASYVFPAEAGSAWAPHIVTDGFREIARKAGIVPPRSRPTTRAGRRSSATTRRGPSRRPPEITFHSLRHTCASLMLSQNVHPKVVQEMLGHSTISITMDLYSHATPSQGAEAAQRLDAVLLLPTAGITSA